MALDGAYLRHLKKELSETLIGGRIDKIHQPNREEFVVAIRTREGLFRLLFSARANSARVGLIPENLENPKQPPMLCMLFRKKLSGARLTEIRQPELERVLHFIFDAVNELGDHVQLQWTIEVMGKYSNIILSDEEGRVIDSLKRVDAEMSSRRLVLPGLAYELPPAQDKLNPLTATGVQVAERLRELPKNAELSKGLLSVLQGLSPVVCRELAHQIGRGQSLFCREMGEEEFFRLSFFYQKFREGLADCSGTPMMVMDRQGKPLDFSFLPLHQYGTDAVVKEGDSFSALLDGFYRERDRMERMRVREQDLLRLLSNQTERLSRKINAQKAELSASGDRDRFRIYGDLINGHLHEIPKGSKLVQLDNFYDPAGGKLTVPLDPALSPSQNAQKYYKAYRKAKTAEEKLQEQISLAMGELAYLDTVLESLAQAAAERDLTEIRSELADQGYLRIQRRKQNKTESLQPPRSYQVADGFTVLVGRNNRQNDQLTMKRAKKQDIWFHTKDIPGSHTVLVTQGRTPTVAALEQAAALAAGHSRGKQSAKVPVDYTEIRNVSKPQGAKPGFVHYVKYQTLYVTPISASPAQEEAQ